MTFYYNISTKEYPRYTGDIQLIKPDFNVGDPLPENWVIVNQEELPAYNNFQKVIINEPVNIDGIWVSGWSIVDMTEEEKHNLIQSRMQLEKKPYDSWVFNEDTLSYFAPVPKPGSPEDPYFWHEESMSWKPIIEQSE